MAEGSNRYSMENDDVKAVYPKPLKDGIVKFDKSRDSGQRQGEDDGANTIVVNSDIVPPKYKDGNQRDIKQDPSIEG